MTVSPCPETQSERPRQVSYFICERTDEWNVSLESKTKQINGRREKARGQDDLPHRVRVESDQEVENYTNHHYQRAEDKVRPGPLVSSAIKDNAKHRKDNHCERNYVAQQNGRQRRIAGVETADAAARDNVA